MMRTPDEPAGPRHGWILLAIAAAVAGLSLIRLHPTIRASLTTHGVCMPGDAQPGGSPGTAAATAEPAPLSAPVGTSSIRLREIAAAAGVAEPNSITRAPIWFDYDNDGELDLVFGTLWTPSHIYRNNGDLTFTDVSAAVGLDQTLPFVTQSAAVADYDNDGDPDIYLGNGAAVEDEFNVLYRNDVSTTGRFTDVSVASGTGGFGLPSLYAKTFSAIWVDYDQDGWLDLFVHKGYTHGSLFHNRGDGTFEDRALASGIDVVDAANGVCAGDFDNDGWVDLFVPVWPLTSPGTFAANFLFHNNGDGTFTDVADVAGVQAPNYAFSCAVEDFNNDGWLDLFVMTWRRAQDSPEDSKLFINNGDGTFTDRAADAGVNISTNSMGLQTGDLDNDGFPEIFVGRGDPQTVASDILFHNESDPAAGRVAFTDISEDSGLRAVPLHRSHGTTMADFDHDGDLDLLVGNGGAFADQSEPNFLFQNVSSLQNGWVKLKLRGSISNRDAIGARVAAEVGGRTLYKMVSGGNGFNTRNDLELLVGLGASPSLNRILILWPSRILQIVDPPPLGTRLEVRETGIKAPAVVVPGSPAIVRIAGPPGATYELRVSDRLSATAEALFTFDRHGNMAGKTFLAEPTLLAGLGVIPDSGVRDVSVPIPDEATLTDRFLYFQAGITTNGSTYVSNVAVASVEDGSLGTGGPLKRP